MYNQEEEIYICAKVPDSYQTKPPVTDRGIDFQYGREQLYMSTDIYPETNNSLDLEDVNLTSVVTPSKYCMGIKEIASLTFNCQRNNNFVNLDEEDSWDVDPDPDLELTPFTHVSLSVERLTLPNKGKKSGSGDGSGDGPIDKLGNYFKFLAKKIGCK